MKKLNILFVCLIMIGVSSVVYSKKIEFCDDKFLDIELNNCAISPKTSSTKNKIVFTFNELQKNLKVQSWTFSIYKQNSNEIIYTALDKKELPKQLIWDGCLSDGKVADEGIYRYCFIAQINKKLFKIEKDCIIIDTTSPFLSISSSTENIFVDKNNKLEKPAEFSLTLGDENEIDFTNTSLDIVNFNGKIIKQWLFDDKKIPNKIIWDGKDDIYNKLVPFGEYKVVLTAYDIAGNTSSVSKQISVLELVQGKIENIVVKEEERGLVVNLSSNILFASGSSKLKVDSKTALKETIDLLNAYPANKVLIEGHTDSSGSKKKNLQLSYERAQSVYDFFVQNNINAQRLQVVGYGQDKPISSNKTKQGRSENRRVTIVILKNK